MGVGWNAARRVATGAVVLAALTPAPVLATSAGTHAADAADRRGSIEITTRGLPKGQRGLIVVTGPAVHRVITTSRTKLGDLRAGTYALVLRPVIIPRSQGRIRAGAIAYPAKGRVLIRLGAGAKVAVVGRYTGIVNALVKPLPIPLLGVIGNVSDPLAVVLPRGARRPQVGTIFTSGPVTQLPYGLISKVTRVSRQGRWLLVSLSSVPLTDATPELSFTGSLPLTPATEATQQLGSASSAGEASAHAADNCGAPKLLQFGAHLDSVELRRAFLGAWPPQLELTLAVRTTESLGVAAAAAGINCDWTIGEIGPYDEAIPVGPIVVPIFATLPVNADIHVNGTLNVGTFNVASTTVANVAAGFDFNEASLSQQGSNVWITGSPSISGSAKLSASIGVQAGIGVAKGANVHLEADFGPEFDWQSGHDCNLLLDMGSLSAGVSVFGRSLNTPPFTPLKLKLWSGCQSSPQSPPNQSPSPTPSAPSSPTPTGSSPTPSPSAPQTYAETTGGVTHTWTNYTNAGGYEGQIIPSNTTVQIACKVTGFRVEDGNTWWYRIASSPWNGSYYASADAFYNNGETSGSLLGTPFVDSAVPNC